MLSQSFYRQTQKRYHRRNLNIDSAKLQDFINNLYHQAEKNYLNLPNPKFCSPKAYISIWLNQEISKDIAQKCLTSFNLKNPPDNFKAVSDFYKNYPPPSFKAIKPNQNRNNLHDKKQKWLAVVKERNQFSLDKNNKSRIQTYLDDYYIPISEYQKFLANTDKVIAFCQNQIYSNWEPKSNQNLDNYCLICNSDIFPFKNTNDFLVFFEKNNKFYKKNKEKIKIQFTNDSRTDYIKENDIFQITINNGPHINHQIIDLIHEIGHAETMVKIFKQNKFIKPKAYLLEKLAIKKEIQFLARYFPKALIARQGSILRMVYQTLFEIEIYQDPKKDPNKIYLKYLKKCSPNIKQIDSWNYLSNHDILYKNFTQLIYAIAYINTICESLLSRQKVLP